MELTAKQTVNITSALNSVRIMCPVKYRDARRLNDLRKLFQERSEIVVDMERKLIEANGGTICQDRTLTFPSSDERNAFVKEREKMFAETDDVEFTPLDLSAYVEDIEVAADTLGALDGVLILEKE